VSGLRAKLRYRFGSLLGSFADPFTVVRSNLINKPEFEDAFRAFDSRDLPTAFRLLRELAEEGDPAAQHNLGILYETGYVPLIHALRDDVAAEEWYRKAALQALPQAQYQLSAILVGDLMGGAGTSWTPGEAAELLTQGYVWLLLAEQGGHPEAQSALKRLEPHLTPDQRAEANTVAAQFSPASVPPRLQNVLFKPPDGWRYEPPKEAPPTLWSNFKATFKECFGPALLLGFVATAIIVVSKEHKGLSFFETMNAALEPWTFAHITLRAVPAVLIITSAWSLAIASFRSLPPTAWRIIDIFLNVIIALFGAVLILGFVAIIYSGSF